MLPYFLGCPSWNESAWRGGFYPADLKPNDSLEHYCRVFNTVEGNTTFYARPDQDKLSRWAQHMPAGFRFCAKVHQDISHQGDLREQLDETRAFLDLLAPLGARVTPLWLQLPPQFGPSRLGELAVWLDAFCERRLAVEVRHPAFFEKGEEERALNRLLHERGVERICLDSRALFSCRSRDPAVLHAQSKKPRLPIRPAAFSDSPQVRFIGGPDLQANQAFIEPWLDKVADWIDQGLTPHVYLHTPDNQLAAEQALRFHRSLGERLPGLPDLPPYTDLQPRAEQLGLI